MVDYRLHVAADFFVVSVRFDQFQQLVLLCDWLGVLNGLSYLKWCVFWFEITNKQLSHNCWICSFLALERLLVFNYKCLETFNLYLPFHRSNIAFLSVFGAILIAVKYLQTMSINYFILFGSSRIMLLL